MAAIKTLFEFLWTGIVTILAYLFYTILIFVLTIGAGFPVAIAIAILIEITNRLMNGVF